MTGKSALRRYRRRDRILCAPEGDEKGVALSVDFPAPELVDGRPQEALVLGKGIPVPITEVLEQPSRALDVGEQEGDRSDG
jgi:hypothetical protein